MFNETKYTKWYMSIIDRRRSEAASGYTESHHIIPKSLGGSNHSTNRVTLTAKEHFVCHLLLTRMTSGVNRQKMFLALDCFTKPIQVRPGVRTTSGLFARVRAESALYLSSLRRGNATRPAGTYKHSAETRSKMSASAQGLVRRPVGFTHSESTVDLMRANRRGKGVGNVPWNKGLEQVCPHCGKTVRGTLNRWHGDRCRFNHVSSP